MVTDHGPRTTDHGQPLAVVLASGGMDSCVTIAIAGLHFRLAMLHVTYGQRTEARELQSFNCLADFYHAEHRLVCHLDHLRQIGGSSLTDPRMAVERANLDRRDIPSSYVPFRNAHFLSIAVSWGEVLGRPENLYRCGGGRQFGLSRLPPRILRGFQPCYRGRHQAGNSARDRDPGHSPAEERNRPARNGTGRTLQPHLVLLPGRGVGLWHMRQLRPAAAGV